MGTEIRRTIRPPKPIYLFPQALSLSNTGSQVDNFLAFAPTGNPKYMKGSVASLQLRKLNSIPINSDRTFTPIRKLFWKFTFKPDTISNPLNNALRVHKFSIVASPTHKVYRWNTRKQNTNKDTLR